MPAGWCQGEVSDSGGEARGGAAIEAVVEGRKLGTFVFVLFFDFFNFFSLGPPATKTFANVSSWAKGVKAGITSGSPACSADTSHRFVPAPTAGPGVSKTNTHGGTGVYWGPWSNLGPGQC